MCYLKFDEKFFLSSFMMHIDDTRGRVIEGKTANAVDTFRVFDAVDLACKDYPEFFPPGGKSFWNGKGVREFLCDYTYHNESHRVLLALESEWGTRRSPKKTVEKVVADFKKVVNMASPIKVMVFAYTGQGNERDCLEAMRDMVVHWPQEVIGTLMAISCPWDDEMYSESMSFYFWKNGRWESV